MHFILAEYLFKKKKKLLIRWKNCILALICIYLITSEVEKSRLSICILLVNNLMLFARFPPATFVL